jgi:hypothetical protein
VRLVSPLGSGRMIADSETTIFDVGANGEIDAAAFDYLGRLVPTDVLAVIDRLLAGSQLLRFTRTDQRETGTRPR